MKNTDIFPQRFIIIISYSRERLSEIFWNINAKKVTVFFSFFFTREPIC